MFRTLNFTNNFLKVAYRYAIFLEKSLYMKSIFTSEVSLLFAIRLGLGGNDVCEVIEYLILRGIFTKEYLLINYTHFTENECTNRVYVNINPVNVCDNATKKIKLK